MIDPVRLPSLRAEFSGSPLAAVLVPNALDPAALDRLRARAAAAPFQSYWIADRGKYGFNDSFNDEASFAALAAITAQITGSSGAPVFARLTRHRHGDYAQPKDDDRFWSARALGGSGIDLTLDLSAAASDEGQVVYFSGTGSLVLPQAPGSLALVVRRGPLTRYERYLNHRLGPAEIFRLRLILGGG